MKKKVLIIIGFVIILLVILGFITGKRDKERVNNNEEPKFVIKTISSDGEQITYWGLGYKVVRYVGVSPNEPFKNNIGVKFGSWFMKYELPERNSKNIDDIVLSMKADTLTRKGTTFIIKNNRDIAYMYGPEYIIEKYENNKWQEIATITGEPLVWNTIIYTLKNEEEKEFNVDWSLAYGELSNGKYRLVKSVFKRDDNSVNKTLYLEFEINDTF